MGWTQYTMHKPIKQWFKEQWEYENSDYEALDSSLVNFTVVFGAVKQKSTGDVFCAVHLVRWNKAYDYNFSHKDMTEHCGPGAIHCPKKIFKLLTPLNDENDKNGWAREWREKVENYHKKRDGLKKNCIIHIPAGVSFVGGGNYTYFKKLKFADGHYHQWAAKGKNYCTTFVPYEKVGDDFKMIQTLVRFNPERFEKVEFLL